MRVAVFYQSTVELPGTTRVPLGEGQYTYVRGELLPEGTSLLAALDSAKPGRGENVMNSHPV